MLLVLNNWLIVLDNLNLVDAYAWMDDNNVRSSPSSNPFETF